jgi:hypothetical protein
MTNCGNHFDDHISLIALIIYYFANSFWDNYCSTKTKQSLLGIMGFIVFLLFYLFLAALDFELRDSHLLGSYY